MHIPFHRPITPRSFDEIYNNSIKQGWLTTGPNVKSFENSLSDYMNSNYVVALNSCTAALHLALLSQNFKSGDKFIAPTHTFVASVEVGEYLGMEPVLIDSNQSGFNIDLNIVEDKLKKEKKIKAAIVVHFAGKSIDRESLFFLCSKYNIFLLEDSAHALEIKFNNNYDNDLHALALSFYANKNITTGGEGGAMVTNSKKIAETVRKLSLHGMSKDGWKRFKVGSKWGYDVSMLGYKYNMTDLSASFGISQLKYVEKWAKIRYEIANYYNGSLKHIEGISLPKIQRNNHAWHLYIISINEKLWKINRDEIIELLNEAGIGTSVHYKPVHMHSYYIKKYGYKNIDFPRSSKLFKSIISLPFFPDLKQKEKSHIVETIDQIWLNNKL